MSEEKKEEVVGTEETKVDKGKEFAESLIAKQEESNKSWDGKKLYKASIRGLYSMVMSEIC